MQQTLRLLAFNSTLALFSVLGFFALPQAHAGVGNGAPEMILPKLNLIDSLEVQAGELGESKACNSEVEGFAGDLVADHTAHRQQVQEMAIAQNIDIHRVTLSLWEAREIQKMQNAMVLLQARQGCSFDMIFLEAMIDAHSFAIEVVESAMTVENDQDLAVFLEDTLATLRLHHKMAIDLLAELREDPGSDDGEGSQD